MRLGGPVFGVADDPDAWVAGHRALGYSAAYAPSSDLDDARAQAYVAAAAKADLLIAEVGAWSNTISSDDAERRKAIDHCIKQLAFAERIGAVCCVNIAGSRGATWDGPHPDNLSCETFDLTVQVVRQIIDAVRPTRTCYTLEPMPWVFPDSPDSYLRLIEAIDRKAFAVHLDPVNMINCPLRAYRSGDFLKECFEKLGPHIRSVHAKDIAFTQHLTVHLDERRPGEGCMDYRTFLKKMAKLPADTPLLLEHLSNAKDYELAAQYVRQVANEIGVGFR